MPELGVNIDHVATVRQARRTYEPDPVWAAIEAQLAGAEGITFHLREDRRHINDDDARRLIETVSVKRNMEMAATDEMVELALRLQPDLVMLVPEGRLEVTTEGGLDVVGQHARIEAAVRRLRDAGRTVSAFIDPEPDQIAAAADVGFHVCEVHTGPYAHAAYADGREIRGAAAQAELAKIAAAGEQIRSLGLRFNAGHALNYVNVTPVAALPEIAELHIGHAIVSRAVFVGMREAVREMKRILDAAPS